MPTTPSITGTVRGVSATLQNCVIQSMDVTTSDIAEQVADQNGAIGAEITYDHRTELRLSVIAASSSGPGSLPDAGDDWQFDGSTWRVDSVQEGQRYNGACVWTISAHKYDNSPSGA